MAKASRDPWEKPNPRKRAGEKSKGLSPAKKSAAKARARRAGRRYPNLMDNMRMVARKKKSAPKKSKKGRAGKTAKRERAPVSRSEKKSKKAPKKDPSGGLTATGRKDFAIKDASQLKPGVIKSISQMTPQEMRRKGSWAVRFYGRKKLPPLIDAHQRPTRYALTAHAWGEPVPRTVAAARRIAAKGERLLQRYRRTKSKR
jgi:hypothetical protein